MQCGLFIIIIINTVNIVGGAIQDAWWICELTNH